MLKNLRIKSRIDFVLLQKKPEHKIISNNFIILIKKTKENCIKKNIKIELFRTGIVASKKISNKAVVRNKIKRIIRHLLLINHNYFLQNLDYEIIAKKTFLENNFINLSSELLNSLQNINKFYKKNI